MPKQVTRYYVGPLDEIVTLRLDGSSVVLARGEPITGTTEDAERWDAQPDNWSTSPEATKPRTATEILAVVGEDRERAAIEAEAERARGADARKTLVADLERIVAADNQGDGD